MLTKDAVIARYLFALSCYILSGTQMLTGTLALIAGIVGTIELATALLRYSPIMELFSRDE